MTSKLRIMSADPEVMALQAMLRGLRYIEAKELTPRHFKVLTTVELCIKGLKVVPNAEQIASYVGETTEEIADILLALVESRYLLEVMNKYGDIDMRYKIGQKGGMALKTMLDRKTKQKMV